MGLEDYVSKAIHRTKASFSSDRASWKEYLSKYELKDYFKQDMPDEDRERLDGELEKIVASKCDAYEKDLGGILRRIASKGTMGVDTANSLYALLSSTAPLYNSGALGLILFGGKTLAEIPALYRYVRKSKDWYGAAKLLLSKPLRYLTPVLGPMLEAGAFERMVRKRIIQESKAEFVKQFGNYQTRREYVTSKMKMPLSEAIYLPEEFKEAA